ncbi:MAG TPA: aquaporin [Nocardioides sp.]|nr:aquaporin [Nocardioides sp.]
MAYEGYGHLTLEGLAMSDTVEDTPTTGQKFTAEVLGTFVLVFFGCGAAVYSGGDLVATALAFGLTVLVMAYAVGRISGGHFNPAVTLGAVLSGRLPWSQVGLYMAAQLLGALLAGAVLFGLGHGFEGFVAEGNMGQNFFGDQGSGFAWWAALLLELLMTAVFVWVILSVTDARNEVNVALGPLAIGLSLAMLHLLAIPLTGTSVNPARSIGVGVFAGTDAIVQLWLFVLAPLLGAAIAGLTYPVLFGQGAAPVAGSGLNFGGGRKDQFVPGNYEAQWNQGQPASWGQPGAAWGAPPQQQWGQPDPYQQPQQQPDPVYGAPQSSPPQQPGQWGQPAPQQPAQPGQPQPGQWGAPQQPGQQPAQPVQQPGQQPGQPGHWGNPDGDDDGRTQVRRPD